MREKGREPVTDEPKRKAYAVVVRLIDQHFTHPTEHADVLAELAKIRDAMQAAASIASPSRPEAA